MTSYEVDGLNMLHTWIINYLPINIKYLYIINWFYTCVTDSCIYVRGTYTLGTFIIIVLYVDDMSTATQNINSQYN